MHSGNKPALPICIVLNLVFIVTGSIITEIRELSTEYWTKNEECCMGTFPGDFKYCVNHKRRSLSAPYLGFKSISCQCHAILSTRGVRTQENRIQTFRQCLFTEDENTEEPVVHDADIFKACIEGDLVAVKHIIMNQLEKIYAKTSKERTPIMLAALEGRNGVFNFLACFTCRWNDTDKYKNNILHLASIGGSLNIVKWVVRFADIESKGESERTAVLLAIRNGHVAVAEMLIQAGCNIMVVDRWDSNLLHMACNSDSVKALRYVVSMGLYSLESRESKGLTPLLMAVEQGFLEGCKYLIEQGADVTAADKEGDALLHHVLLCKTRQNVRIDMMNYFLSKAYVNKERQGKFKETPLLLAALKGNIELFQLLVRKGCSTKAVDDNGNSILHSASAGDHYAMVKYILKKAYISPLARDFKGRTALMTAADRGSLGVFKLLERRGCILTTRDDRHNNVLHSACLGGNVKMINYILSFNKFGIDSKGAHGYTPLMYTVRYGNVKAFKLMYGKGCSTHITDDEGNTILHLACKSGKKDMVQLLIERQLAQHYIKVRNDEDQIPKQLAEAKGFDEIVNLLKEVTIM